MRKKIPHFQYKFVEFIPELIDDDVLYISIPYATAIHRCACGCGQEVITPLSPTDWRVIFDGKSVSIDPSIGNWSFDCQSHYFIRRNRVLWCEQWSKERINLGRAYDAYKKKNYNDSLISYAEEEDVSTNSIPPATQKTQGILARVRLLWPF